ncbi:MAG: tetratricopeptide repeat protein [candidate division Zixibacteria bacterium]|nr:tetratricopeptide repeat protein [candidate division Zixibacteria bacterium]
MRVLMLTLMLGFVLVGCSRQAPDIRESAIDEASQEIRSSATLSSDNQLLAGKEQYLKGDYRQAAKHLLRAITNNRQNWEAHYYLGLTQQKLDKNDQAIESFRASLRHCTPERQSTARINYALGCSYEKLGYLPKAREQYANAATLWPDLNEAKDAKARLDGQLPKTQPPPEEPEDEAR